MSEHDPGSEETIFSTALHCASAERASYLGEACAGQPALRQRIEELLKAQPQLGEFMDNPADIGMPGSSETIRLTVPPEERPGTRIGRYKLLQKIGEGGCGVVYMAEQEEPVRRRIGKEKVWGSGEPTPAFRNTRNHVMADLFRRARVARCNVSRRLECLACSAGGGFATTPANGQIE